MLSGKRAHILFGAISIIITGIFSVNNKRVVKNALKLFISTICIIIILIVLNITMDFSNLQSPLVNFLNELEYTIDGFLKGEDITSGRTILYAHSWKLFNENIIFGIGWREFMKNSLGLISSFTSGQGSHPHNIYLQLLTETGLVGFLFFMMPVLYLYSKTYRLLRTLSMKINLHKWKNAVQFSFFSQTFFLLYGLTGNLLTDYNFLLMYFFVASISLSAIVLVKKCNEKET